ncbi:MAG: hypothetical protein KF812_11795 [Fimbriimonadaceae bacterium]|nr:hypothetical protein [Fimbriimonadaceae bacterium]
MISTAIVLGILTQNQNPYIDISRVYKAGETCKYEVRSRLNMSTRELQDTVFYPSSYRIDYDFNYTVKEMKAEGFAAIRYNRPTMTMTEGETAQSPPVATVEQTKWVLDMTLSPANEITGIEEVKALRFNATAFTPGSAFQQDIIGQFTGELQRLALFAGSVDTALDMSPKLPYDEVRVGDVWKRTVGYTPQRLSGTNRSAVQRLDYEYRYDGIVDVDGVKVHRVTATLAVDTNAAEFINQLYGQPASVTGLQAVNLKLNATIVFDLDEKTRHTIRAAATSEGGYDIRLARAPNVPVVEQTLKGRSNLKLVSRTLGS